MDHIGQFCYTAIDQCGQLLEGRAIKKAFFELPEEKQQSILNAAFAEFGDQGYKRASTNTIVKNANISKGLLFYYFNNKKELFNELTLHAIENTLHRYDAYLAEESPDFLEWMYATAAEKTKIQQENPAQAKFLGQIYLSNDRQYLNDSVKKSFENMVSRSLAALNKPFDMSAFRDDIPAPLLRNMVIWLTDGYQKQLTSRMEADHSLWEEENMQTLWDEFYEYLAVMKKIFYKKGKDQ